MQEGLHPRRPDFYMVIWENEMNPLKLKTLLHATVSSQSSSYLTSQESLTQLSTASSINYFLHLVFNTILCPGFPPTSLAISSLQALSLPPSLLISEHCGAQSLDFLSLLSILTPFVISSCLLALNTTYRLMT